jgi:hypothetical protein
MASEDYLKALGEVTSEASGLEWCIAHLLASALGRDEGFVPEVTRTPGRLRKELTNFSRRVQEEHEHACPFAEGVAGLTERTFSVLDQRNTLVHSVEIIELSEWGESIVSMMSNPRTGPLKHTSVDELLRLAAKIRGVGGTALRMRTNITQWRSIHSAYWT